MAPWTRLAYQTTARSQRRSMSVRSRTILGALLLVVVTVVAYAVLLTGVIDRQVVSGMSLHARSASDRLQKAVLPAALARDMQGVERAIARAMEDARVSFVAWRPADEHTEADRAIHIRDPEAWASWTARLEDPGGAPFPAGAVTLKASDGQTVGVSVRRILWSPRGELCGTLDLGVVYPSYATLRRDLRRTATIAACAVALCVTPLVLLAARRLITPLRRVAQAAESLAHGHRPDPLPEGGPPELAGLGRAFNNMASSLSDAREELLAANTSLEATVLERTAELRRLNEMLSLEIRQKNEFLRTVSHDLGAPLRNIAGMTAMIMRKHGDELSDEATHRLERINANVLMESEMLADLLELSRLGMEEERPVATSVREAALSIGASFDHELRTRAIEFIVDDDLPALRVEPGKLRVVIQNLVDNAIKYMGEAPTRRIRVGRAENDGAIGFFVQDTGPGVPAEETDRIFQVFRRGSSAGDVAGRGIGLAAVRAVVERWSGSIEVEGGSRIGARFVVLAPRERLAPAQVAVADARDLLGPPGGAWSDPSGDGRAVP